MTLVVAIRAIRCVSSLYLLRAVDDNPKLSLTVFKLLPILVQSIGDAVLPVSSIAVLKTQ